MINYSMCWEDYTLLDTLSVGSKDNVLCVGSGGENALHLLLKGPKRLTIVDLNAEQLYLIELKMCAIEHLPYERGLAFLGVVDGKKRLSTYHTLSKHLSEDARVFFSKNLKLVEKGIIHAGKFERYLELFRSYLLPLLVSKKRIKQYLQCSTLADQKQEIKKWYTPRFKMLFRFFFSRFIMSIFGRSPSYFKYAKKSVGKYYLEKARRGLAEISVKDNPFVHYILTKKIPFPLNDHPYLNKENYRKLPSYFSRVSFAHADYKEYMKNHQVYVLSNVFELCSQEEYEKNIEALSKSSARWCYWNNLVNRSMHSSKVKKLKVKQDRIFFYSKFIAESSA